MKSKDPFTWKSARIILGLRSSERGMCSAFSLHADDDRIVSHDAIFYVHDATSKLSVISSRNNVVFNVVLFLFVL